jgi:hypothetical protein
MLAAAFYLSKDMQVYFPICQQGPIDFIVEKEGGYKRVQVKTACWITSGNNKYLQCRTRLTNKYQDVTPVELYDILFIISNIGYWEIPSFEIDSSNISLQNTGRNKCRWEEYKINTH